MAYNNSFLDLDVHLQTAGLGAGSEGTTQLRREWGADATLRKRSSTIGRTREAIFCNIV